MKRVLRVGSNIGYISCIYKTALSVQNPWFINTDAFHAHVCVYRNMLYYLEFQVSINEHSFSYGIDN